MSEPLRVLFVCTANICRSPVMELTARALASQIPAAQTDDAAIEFASAGTAGFDSSPIDEEMAATLEPGPALDASGDFRSRELTAAHLTGADLVLTAEAVHRSRILEEQPQLHRRVFTLGQFASTIDRIPDLSGRELIAEAGTRRTPPRPEDDVPDPYRRGRAAAETATGTITAMLRTVVPRLVGPRPTER